VQFEPALDPVDLLAQTIYLELQDSPTTPSVLPPSTVEDAAPRLEMFAQTGGSHRRTLMAKRLLSDTMQ
jgi:hypothetical protein